MSNYTENTLIYLKGHYRELFRVAYAIAGNAELAEFALIKALNSILSDFEKKGSLREVFFRAVADSAFSQRSRLDGDTYPMNFSCFELSDESDEGGAWLAAQKSEVRRILFLRFGCRLGTGNIARAMGISRQDARNALVQAQANFSRAITEIPFEKALSHYAKLELSRTDVFAPDPGSILRTVEASGSQEKKPLFSISKIIRTVLSVVLALILAGLFWIFAAVTGTAPDASTPVSSPATTEIAASPLS